MPTDAKENQPNSAGMSASRLCFLTGGALLGGWAGLKIGLALAQYPATGNWSWGYIGCAVGGFAGGAAGQLASRMFQNRPTSPQWEERPVQRVKQIDSPDQTRAQEHAVEIGGHADFLKNRKTQPLDLNR